MAFLFVIFILSVIRSHNLISDLVPMLIHVSVQFVNLYVISFIFGKNNCLKC